MTDPVILDRAGITVSGPGARDFLQGLISQDINLLSTEPIIYTAFLNQHGRFLCDAFIWFMNDIYVVDTAPDPVRHDLMQHLKKYRLRSQVQMDPIDISVTAHLDHPPAPSPEIMTARDPRDPNMGWRTVSLTPHLTDTDVSVDLPLKGGGEATYHHRRITLGIPEGSMDAEIGVSTPEELYLPRLNAVSFTKGCYLGQELTARMEHRGLGKRHVYRVAIAASNRDFPPPEGGREILPQRVSAALQNRVGVINNSKIVTPSVTLERDTSPLQGEEKSAPIFFHDKHVGTLRSTCDDIGLALLRDDAVQGMAEIRIEPTGNGWQIISPSPSQG